MGKFIIRDHLLAPRYKISMRFKCKNPFLIHDIIQKLLQDVLKVTGKDVYEHRVTWDDTSVNREFFGHWHGQDECDRWSMKYITVKAQGAQNAETKMGWVQIWIEGELVTEFSYSNPFQRFFFEMFRRVFYSKQRREYIEEANDNIKEIKTRIRAAYGMPEKE